MRKVDPAKLLLAATLAKGGLRDGPPPYVWDFPGGGLSAEEMRVAYYWEYGIEADEVVAEITRVRERLALRQANAQAMREWVQTHPYPPDLAMRVYGHMYMTDQWLTHGHCLGKASERHKSKMLVISTLSNRI